MKKQYRETVMLNPHAQELKKELKRVTNWVGTAIKQGTEIPSLMLSYILKYLQLKETKCTFDIGITQKKMEIN
jgi:hypothetical protein